MSLRGYIKKGKPANWLAVEGAVPIATTKRVPKPPKARKRIAAVSLRALPELRAYSQEALDFVAAAVARGESCVIVAAIPELRNGFRYGHPISDRLVHSHHKYGRLGRLLRWQPGFMAVSLAGHRWIDSNRAEARARGWLGPEGTWNDYDRAVAHYESQNK